MYKKILILILIVTFLIAITAFMYITLRKGDSGDQYIASSTDELVLPRSPSRPTTTPSTSTIPVQKPTMSWSMTSETENTLRARWTRVSQGVIGHDTSGYVIEYSRYFKWFSILIISEPAAQYRKEAEAELLAATSMSEEQACDFEIYVQRSTELTGLKDFQDIGLSFCPGSVSDEQLLIPSFDEPE